MKLTLSTTVNGITVDLQIAGDNADTATALLARVIEAVRAEDELNDSGEGEIDKAFETVLGDPETRSDEACTREHGTNAVEIDTVGFGTALDGVIEGAACLEAPDPRPVSASELAEMHRLSQARAALDDKANALLLFLHAAGDPAFVENGQFESSILACTHSTEALSALLAADAVRVRAAPPDWSRSPAARLRMAWDRHDLPEVPRDATGAVAPCRVYLKPWGTARALELAADAARMAAVVRTNGTTHA